MSLHLVFSSTGLSACTRRRQRNDKLVLLGNGVYAHQQALDAGVEPADLYLLAADAQARGVSQAAAALAHIDYPTLVELTQQCSPIVSWND